MPGSHVIPATLTRIFESAAQAITSAGLLTLAHGLGLKPKVIRCYVECLTAEHGHSIGDEVEVSMFSYKGTATAGYSLYADATNVYLRFHNNASPLVILDNAGAPQRLTNASWSLYVRAFA